MATQAELTVDGGAERRSVIGTIGGWLASRDLRALTALRRRPSLANRAKPGWRNW